ncbi:MAG: hypothetical protein SAL70_09980 [Scytonema sp. PMC 1070.18]|nr:hypothetical protein [Scytonema sp. PMC 1070.18]
MFSKGSILSLLHDLQFNALSPLMEMAIATFTHTFSVKVYAIREWLF